MLKIIIYSLICLVLVSGCGSEEKATAEENEDGLLDMGEVKEEVSKKEEDKDINTDEEKSESELEEDKEEESNNKDTTDIKENNDTNRNEKTNTEDTKDSGNDNTAKEEEPTKTEEIEPEPKTEPKDTTKPILSGVTNKTIEYGDSINLKSGISASDNKDGNITSRIKVNGSVDSNKSGKYTITYSVSDNAGNKATKSRVITVKESVFTYNSSVTNKVIAEQKNRRLQFDYYTDNKGDKVTYFDDIFKKFHTGQYSVDKVRSILSGYSWEEPPYKFENPTGISSYNIPALYLDVKLGEIKSSDPNKILDSIYYSTGSDYSRVAVYTNSQGMSRIYAIYFPIY